MAKKEKSVSKLRVRLMLADEPNYSIAGKTDIHPTTLSNYALGKRKPTEKHLRALCRYFQCREEDLLGETLFVWDEVRRGSH